MVSVVAYVDGIYYYYYYYMYYAKQNSKQQSQLYSLLHNYVLYIYTHVELNAPLQ